MVSHKHKCIFLHIPKAAGTSIERFLRDIDSDIPSKVLRKRGFSRFLNDHLDYYVFSMVRNPCDRLVSAWKWGEFKLRNEPSCPYYQKSRSVSFEEYVQLLVDENYRHFNRLCWSEYDEYHTLPQFEFFPHLNGGHYFTDKIDSNFTCDFIGRFENLKEDFGKICSDLNFDKLELPHVFNSKKFKEEFSWTAQLKDKVHSYYQKDFDLFGYES
tara:strand:+ start:6449 stop:7087 length:639 start_codon:yes stop_codon:yes gene_type:complete